MLAYLDSFTGLIKCRVLQLETVQEPGAMFPVTYARCKVTSRTSRAYKPGQIVDVTTRMVVPRDSVTRRRYTSTIAPYNWRAIAPKLFKESGNV